MFIFNMQCSTFSSAAPFWFVLRFNTLQALALAADEKTVVYFAFQLRSTRAETALFAALARWFDWSELPVADYHPDFQAPKVTIYVLQKKLRALLSQ
jgi:hypothetical protein